MKLLEENQIDTTISTNTEIVDQLNQLLNVIVQVKEQINSTQILKSKSNDCKHISHRENFLFL